MGVFPKKHLFAPVILRLQLALDRVEEAEIRPLGDDLLWARLDHARLKEAQCVEANESAGSYSRHRSCPVFCSVVRARS